MCKRVCTFEKYHRTMPLPMYFIPKRAPHLIWSKTDENFRICRPFTYMPTLLYILGMLAARYIWQIAWSRLLSNLQRNKEHFDVFADLLRELAENWKRKSTDKSIFCMILCLSCLWYKYFRKAEKVLSSSSPNDLLT